MGIVQVNHLMVALEVFYSSHTLVAVRGSEVFLVYLDRAVYCVYFFLAWFPFGSFRIYRFYAGMTKALEALAAHNACGSLCSFDGAQLLQSLLGTTIEASSTLHGRLVYFNRYQQVN